jgi:hypothetical protein
LYYSLGGHHGAGDCSYSLLPGAIQKQAMARILKGNLLRILAGKPPRRQQRRNGRSLQNSLQSSLQSGTGEGKDKAAFLEELKSNAATDLQCLEVVCLMVLPSLYPPAATRARERRDSIAGSRSTSLPRPTVSDYLSARPESEDQTAANEALAAEAHTLLVGIVLGFLPGTACRRFPPLAATSIAATSSGNGTPAMLLNIPTPAILLTMPTPAILSTMPSPAILHPL